MSHCTNCSLYHSYRYLFLQSSTRKSAILSAAKKAKLKSNPSRVRFAESVDISNLPNGQSVSNEWICH